MASDRLPELNCVVSTEGRNPIKKTQVEPGAPT